MNDHQKAIENYFSKLGLEPEVAAIYLTLHTYGAQTMSDLARNSGVERTMIYRLLPTLTQHNLIEVESEYKHGIIKAAPFANLQIILSKKEQELEDLQKSFPLLEESLTQIAATSPDTKVQFYRGADGVKQMLWNETKAKDEILSILYENIQIRTNSKFFERWVEKCNDAGISFRGIVSDTFLESQKKWYSEHTNNRLEKWEERYVSPETFEISHSTVVYGDVVAHFNWNDTEVFGIEIYNKQIADTQRQLFKLLWQVTEPKK